MQVLIYNERSKNLIDSSLVVLLSFFFTFGPRPILFINFFPISNSIFFPLEEWEHVPLKMGKIFIDKTGPKVILQK